MSTTSEASAQGAVRHLEVRRGAYHDSVTLMVVSQRAGELPGVRSALVAMATPLNLDLLRRAGHDPGDAGPNDLVVAVAADDDAALGQARTEIEAALADDHGGEGGGLDAEAAPARTLGAATRRADAGLALVSVPGEHAFTEAMDALRAGANVMVFSDNVPLDHEVALKGEARRRDRLVMGPDAGTAIVSGVGLGFANVTRPGPVGLVSASGTGAQQLCALLDAADVGVSHVLGVGGRDLSAEVGAASTLQALAALDADPATEIIVVLSKPPDKAVAERVREAAAACTTPVVLGLVGRGERDLTEVADAAVALLGRTPSEAPSWPAGEPAPPGGFETVRGLFAGGTLCDEAMVIASEALGPISSNVPLEPDWALAPEEPLEGVEGAAHAMIDYGDDALTVGRPHPMIDSTIRADRLAAEARSGLRTVVLLDVVLGHAADPDPAAGLAPAIADARRASRETGGALAVVVSLVGTRDDPQGLDRQARALAAAGAAVYLSNAAATRAALDLLGGVR